MAARHMRFDAVKPGHVFEHKFGQYIKLDAVRSVKNNCLYNAITESGCIVNFYGYEEVLDLGSFKKERKYATTTSKSRV